MITGIIGRKIGMTKIFDTNGDIVPVTVIEAGPCPIVQVITKEKNGYQAIQIGFGGKKKKLVPKAMLGHFEKAKVEPKRFLREVKAVIDDKIQVGQEVKVDIFHPGEKVDIIGISKGHGFQGGVRRHHFAGGPKSHGQSDRLRAPGSIGGSSFPSHTWKGQKMAGRMGGEQVTTKNLQIVDVDLQKNLLLIKGAVPGKKNSLVTVKKIKTRTI